MLSQKKKYFNLRPAVIITAGLIIGILLGGVKLNATLSFVLFILLGVAIGFVSVVCFYKNKKFYGAVFALSLLSLILGLIFIKIDMDSRIFSEGNGQFLGYVYEINSESLIDGKYFYSLTVKGDFLGSKNALCYVDLSSKERIFYGSEISFYGSFEKLDKVYSYDVLCFASDVSLVEIGSLNGLIPILRNKLLISLQNHAGDNYGLTYALLTGDTSYVSSGVLYKYQKIGVAHLFAVSGLHIGLMYGLLFFIVKLCKCSGRYRFIIISFLLLCYVGFCGFSPSSMRAFIIVVVREFAFLTGRKPDASSNLALSAFIVLTINPTDLFSVSFLLSFSVYLGLILLATPLSRFLSKYLPKTISKLLSSSIIAQVVSMPILLEYFGYSSIFSFLFNMALIPFISFLYPFIFISSILLTIFNFEIFSLIPRFTFFVTEFILNRANVDLFLIENVNVSYACVPYYLFLYSFAKKFNFTRKTYIILRIILLSLTVLLFCALNASIYY
ncbi:MAG: ComEC/Rec2 family competence protein [Clostridiales bacterium]|nr:ComEC/Rec2 family competence protein [Clostridiales bacterium]